MDRLSSDDDRTQQHAERAGVWDGAALIGGDVAGGPDAVIALEMVAFAPSLRLVSAFTIRTQIEAESKGPSLGGAELRCGLWPTS